MLETWKKVLDQGEYEYIWAIAMRLSKFIDCQVMTKLYMKSYLVKKFLVNGKE